MVRRPAVETGYSRGGLQANPPLRNSWVQGCERIRGACNNTLQSASSSTQLLPPTQITQYHLRSAGVRIALSTIGERCGTPLVGPSVPGPPATCIIDVAEPRGRALRRGARVKPAARGNTARRRSRLVPVSGHFEHATMSPRLRRGEEVSQKSILVQILSTFTPFLF